MIRVIRPLRMISRNEGLKIAVLSLINSAKGIFHVFIISLLFFLLFGIFGINYFKGSFYSCEQALDLEIVDKWDCLNAGGVWANEAFNFDNILNAIRTLFAMSSTEGWTSVMWNGIDASGINLEPILNSGPLWALFFIAFILFGSLFIMNLFVGVVINTFNEENDKLGQDHLLTETQREWVQT